MKQSQEPQKPTEGTMLLDTYTVHAATTYPDGAEHPGVGAVILEGEGRDNATGEPVKLCVTLAPELALSLARDLRQGFQRVPATLRHDRRAGQ